MENNKLDKRTKWSYCIGATGRDMAYALISMFLLTYIQYTMKLTVAQYAVISAIMVVCLLFLQDNPDSFDLVEWVLFDTQTESVYEAEVDKLYDK